MTAVDFQLKRLLPTRELTNLAVADAEAERIRVELDWKLAAFGAFFSESLDQVVLVRLGDYAKKSTTWSLPGGGVEPDEQPSKAIARELEEEAGIGIEDGLRLAAWLPRPWFRPWNRPDKPGELILLFAGIANHNAPLRPNPPETLAADFVPFTLDRLLAAADLSEAEHPQGGIRKHWCYWARLGQRALQRQLDPPVVWSYENREAMAQPPWKQLTTTESPTAITS
jgi:8-oxo-dGTP pyrophosphatase MutT (NUDIX family)